MFIRQRRPKRINVTTWMVLLVVFLFSIEATAVTQDSITFGTTDIQNNFPNGLTFTVPVASSAGDITAIKLFYAPRNATSVERISIDIEPASQLEVSHTWNTHNSTVPPSMPIFYHWEATDSAGNRVSSEETLFYYDDIRYQWQTAGNESFSIWWHDQPEQFGEHVFAIAEVAFEEQRNLFQAELSYPVRIIVYNDFNEFGSWHSFISEFVGGQAFPALGITAQVVSAYESEEVWLYEVIPHEISHLYFYQVSYHPLSGAPAWLNEGVAQYNEFADNTQDLLTAQVAIEQGELIPLSALTGSFGFDEGKVHLAYQESLSAVSYLVETYGKQGLSNLLAAYKSGQSYQQAFMSAFGITPTEFEQDWLTWLGIPEGMYAPPTATPTLAWPPTPPMAELPTAHPPKTSTPTPKPTSTFTSTPGAVSSAPASASATPTTNRPQPPAPQEAIATKTAGKDICLSAIAPATVLLIGATRFGWRRRKRGRP